MNIVNPRIINNEEKYRVRCEKCFFEKYGRKHKSWNVITTDLCFFLDVSEDLIKEKRKENIISLSNMIKLYGEIEGKKRWKNYCKKQAESNSYKYKTKKHGWDKKMFNSYNKSRSHTLSNMIERHGERVIKPLAGLGQSNAFAGPVEQAHVQMTPASSQYISTPTIYFSLKQMQGHTSLSSNSSLPTPQSGQSQPSGRSSNDVPGSMPSIGSPSLGS